MLSTKDKDYLTKTPTSGMRNLILEVGQSCPTEFQNTVDYYYCP